MPIPERFRSTEKKILQVKSDLERISRNRLIAYRDGRFEEAAQAQIRLLDAELKNVAALASYVRTISPAAARELVGRHAVAAERFERLRKAGDPVALQDWLKRELAPLVNKSEQAAHLVATSIRLERGKRSKPFGWQREREK